MEIIHAIGALMISLAVAGSLTYLKQSLKQYYRRQRQY